MDLEATYKDKVCVITGAASGIGRAMALQLAGYGAALALSDVDEAGLEETISLMPTRPNRLMTDIVDMSDADAIAAYAPTVEASLGAADFVFNNAGFSRVGLFADTDLAAFESVMDVNFYGPVRMCKAFLPQLQKTRGGITNISSLFGLVGFPAQTHYCASKFGLRGFSETLAMELEPMGISVSSVHPGGVDTNVMRNARIDRIPVPGSSHEKMTRDFAKNAKTTPEQAAQIILRGTAKGDRRIIVGSDARLLSFIQRLFPASYAKFLKRLGLIKNVKR